MRRSCHGRKGEKGRCKGLIKRRAAALPRLDPFTNGSAHRAFILILKKEPVK